MMRCRQIEFSLNQEVRPEDRDYSLRLLRSFARTSSGDDGFVKNYTKRSALHGPGECIRFRAWTLVVHLPRRTAERWEHD